VIDITVLKPRDPALGRFIRHFYFLKSESADFRQSYVTFPQLTTPVSLFNRVRCLRQPDRRQATCFHDPEAGPYGEVDGIFTRPMLIDYRGLIDEITIVFEPLGLNQFLECDYAAVAVGPISQTFNPYGDEVVQFLSDLFAEERVEQRRQLLEDFFLAHYRPFHNDVLLRSLEILVDADSDMSISEIARSLGVSHKTLTRLYQRHLGSTPVVLRRIARFRRSLELRLGGRDSSNLTQIAQLSNYYDQPQFIKQYHQLTGESPSEFFRHVSALGSRDIFWRML
jgi:AraC-like DNA-binding protein